MGSDLVPQETTQSELCACAWKIVQQGRQCTYDVTLRRVRVTIDTVLVSLVIRHEKRIYSVNVSSVASLTLPYFHTVS